MSAIFVHDDEQQRLAWAAAKTTGERLGKLVKTEILPFTGFTLAEDYHQKYQLRRLDVVERELEAIYPELEDFVRSTVATRLNGFAGGVGTQKELDTIAGDLGLSEDALRELRRAVR